MITKEMVDKLIIEAENELQQEDTDRLKKSYKRIIEKLKFAHGHVDMLKAKKDEFHKLFIAGEIEDAIRLGRDLGY